MAPSAYAKPAESLRIIFKSYQKANRTALASDDQIIDFERGLTQDQKACIHARRALDVQQALVNFLTDDGKSPVDTAILGANPFAYSHELFPGLCLLPYLLPSCVQEKMLEKLLHRDLTEPRHKTNVHFHHTLKYPSGQERSFFDLSPLDNKTVIPIDADQHRPMSVGDFLGKKLRWCTLGGQYDWTRKTYPDAEPPAFPEDLRRLLHGLFPRTMPEAAIVNVYSPGDVLSLHRDVSEQCNNGLISISLGCDAIFMMALDDEQNGLRTTKHLTIRLRSGDAVYMDGTTRYAWHGVPQIISNTCPPDLANWPARAPDSSATDCEPDAYLEWRSWMAKKRVNLNVRQMRSSP